MIQINEFMAASVIVWLILVAYYYRCKYLVARESSEMWEDAYNQMKEFNDNLLNKHEDDTGK